MLRDNSTSLCTFRYVAISPLQCYAIAKKTCHNLITVINLLIFQINNTDVEVWSKPILPVCSFAVAFLQLSNHGNPTLVSVFGRDIGLTNPDGYDVTDGFTGESLTPAHPDVTLKIIVNPNGVVLFKAVLS